MNPEPAKDMHYAIASEVALDTRENGQAAPHGRVINPVGFVYVSFCFHSSNILHSGVKFNGSV